MTDYDSEEWKDAVDKYVEILILTGRVQVGDGAGGIKGAREMAESELRRLTLTLSDKSMKMRSFHEPQGPDTGTRSVKRKAPTWPSKGEPGY